MTRAANEYIESWRFLAAVILVAATSLSSSTINPVLVGLFVDKLGLTLQQAGLVTACEAAGYALGHLLFVVVAHRWNRRSTACAGALLVMFMNWLTIAPEGVGELAPIRLAAGFGMGVTFSVTTSLMAARSKPAAAFSIAVACALFYAAALVSAAPAISARFGMSGLMYSVIALGAVGFTAALWLPAHVNESIRVAAAGAATTTRQQRIAALRLGLMLMLLLQVTTRCGVIRSASVSRSVWTHKWSGKFSAFRSWVQSRARCSHFATASGSEQLGYR